MANLPAGLTAYLRDAATGQQTALAPGTALRLPLVAGQSTR